MTNMTKNANNTTKTYHKGFYLLVGQACGCSAAYVSRVLNNKRPNYKGKDCKDRNTLMAKLIRRKAEELEQWAQPQD